MKSLHLSLAASKTQMEKRHRNPFFTAQNAMSQRLWVITSTPKFINSTYHLQIEFWFDLFNLFMCCWCWLFIFYFVFFVGFHLSYLSFKVGGRESVAKFRKWQWVWRVNEAGVGWASRVTGGRVTRGVMAASLSLTLLPHSPYLYAIPHQAICTLHTK